MSAETPVDVRPARPRRFGRRGRVAITLVVVGLLFWLASRLIAGNEALSYAPGAAPPSDIALTAGHTYAISLPGGVSRPDYPGRLTCSLTTETGDRSTLQLATEADDTRALNQLARFVSPASGRAKVTCAGLPPVFVDDADDAPGDVSGLCLVLACILLAVGLPLLLSVLRRPARPRP